MRYDKWAAAIFTLQRGTVMKSIVCYGDSNTWGYNAADGNRFPFDVRWTGRLAAALPEARIIEEGLNGRTTALDDEDEADRNGLARLAMILKTHDPVDVLVLALGVNDTKTKFQRSADEIASSLGKCIELAQHPDRWSREHAPAILVVAPPPVTEDCFGSPMSDEFGAHSVRVAGELASAYQKIAESCHCAFLDAGISIRPGALDGVHLDAEGHRNMAELLLPVLQDLNRKAPVMT